MTHEPAAAAAHRLPESPQRLTDGQATNSARVRREPPMSLQPPRIPVVNWHELTAEDARAQWHRLDRWVTQIRSDYGLAPNVIPPLWHRHWELVWELSALHLFWLNAYDPGAQSTSPLMFQRHFAETRTRLREWVATCGTKLDTDRPTRQTAWPGEEPHPTAPEQPILDRHADFTAFVAADVARRRSAQGPDRDALTLLIGQDWRTDEPEAGAS